MTRLWNCDTNELKGYAARVSGNRAVCTMHVETTVRFRFPQRAMAEAFVAIGWADRIKVTRVGNVVTATAVKPLLALAR